MTIIIQNEYRKNYFDIRVIRFNRSRQSIEINRFDMSLYCRIDHFSNETMESRDASKINCILNCNCKFEIYYRHTVIYLSSQFPTIIFNRFQWTKPVNAVYVRLLINIDVSRRTEICTRIYFICNVDFVSFRTVVTWVWKNVMPFRHAVDYSWEQTE